jgi:hypothetical protein
MQSWLCIVWTILADFGSLGTLLPGTIDEAAQADQGLMATI